MQNLHQDFAQNLVRCARALQHADEHGNGEEAARLARACSRLASAGTYLGKLIDEQEAQPPTAPHVRSRWRPVRPNSA